jgi:hypothetical protein
MKMSLRVEYLKNLLKGAKKQFINAAICNSTGKWSEEYFMIDDLKVIRTEQGRVVILFVHSSNNSECAAIDIRHISALRFNKYLNIGGTLVDEVSINSKKMVQ